MTRPPADAIPMPVLDQAAEWLVQLNASTVTDADRRACERWRHAHPDHARAWRRVERLLGAMADVPPELALPALDRPRSPRRRAALRALGGGIALVPVAWLGWRGAAQAGWMAHHRTAPGERRQWTLADGSTVLLNTDSALDVSFDGTARRLRLHRGEVLVQTAPDALARTLFVETAQARIVALGTRFLVRQHATDGEVAVFEHAVRIEPTGGDARTHRHVAAGETARFTAAGVTAATPLSTGTGSWQQGMLLADGMRLAELIEELGRYRRGWLHCDPDVADIRVSGTFPVDDTDRALRMLDATYPVRVSSRLGGRWVRVGPASAKAASEA